MLDWKQKIENYCKKYNIPILYLAETLYEPKVVPMIRGKAFEFSVMMALQEILPKDKWLVDKPMMNAQSGLHDIDVRVQHKKTGRSIRIECKLAKKGGFSAFEDGHTEIRVKCMRSRTLGPAKVKEIAPKLGVSEEALTVHNDQYLPADYDIVITSIGNAFYTTDKKTGFFEWRPTEKGADFLEKIACSKLTDLRDFAFNTLFIAKTSDLAINNNGVTCTRSLCKNRKRCGFIPNYPIIFFEKNKTIPSNGWHPLKESEKIFNELLGD